jgi:hypothetical protein
MLDEVPLRESVSREQEAYEQGAKAHSSATLSLMTPSAHTYGCV